MLVIGFVFWVFGWSSGPILLIPASVGATLIAVWLMGFIFVRNNEPHTTLGNLRSDSVLPEHSPTHPPVEVVWQRSPSAYSGQMEILQAHAIADALRPKADRATLEELERHYELRKREPNLVFVKSTLIGAHEDAQGRIIEGNDGQNLTFWAVVAEFNNKIIGQRRVIGLAKHISAKLTYSFFDGRSPFTLSRGVWVHAGSKADFEPNDTHQLIIVTTEGYEEHQNYALNGSLVGRGPKRENLPDGLVKVAVALVAESESKELNRFEFMIDSNRDSDILINTQLFEMWKWKYDRLVELTQQGIKLVERYKIAGAKPDGLSELGPWRVFVDSESEVEGEIDRWAATVSKWLATHVSEQQQTAFIVAGSPGPQRPDVMSCLLSATKLLIDITSSIEQAK